MSQTATVSVASDQALLPAFGSAFGGAFADGWEGFRASLRNGVASYTKKLQAPSGNRESRLAAGGDNSLESLAHAVCTFGGELCAKLQQSVEELPLMKRFEDTPLTLTLPVFTVGTIMGTMYVCFVGVFMPATGVALHSVHSVIFHTSFVLAVASYHQGIIIDPGRIPDDWRGEPGGRPLFAQLGGIHFDPIERKKSRTDRFRYCNKERKFKPDRAHYCSVMSRNVLRMDHYCPWLSNCVGFYNHKHFFLFLMYTVLAIDLTTADLLWGMLTLHGMSSMQIFMMSHGVFLSSLLSLTLTPFFGFHCWLLSNNMTTIEFCERRGRGGAAPVTVQLDGSPYDVGLFRNIQCVLGQDWYLWLLPVGGPCGNGLDWEISAACRQLLDAEEVSAPARTLLGGVRLHQEGAAAASAASSASTSAASADVSAAEGAAVEGGSSSEATAEAGTQDCREPQPEATPEATDPGRRPNASPVLGLQSLKEVSSSVHNPLPNASLAVRELCGDVAAQLRQGANCLWDKVASSLSDRYGGPHERSVPRISTTVHDARALARASRNRVQRHVA